MFLAERLGEFPCVPSAAGGLLVDETTRVVPFIFLKRAYPPNADLIGMDLQTQT